MPNKVKKTEIMSYPPSKKTENTTNGEVANKVDAERFLLINEWLIFFEIVDTKYTEPMKNKTKSNFHHIISTALDGKISDSKAKFEPLAGEVKPKIDNGIFQIAKIA